jgi:hypothetical protein
VPARLERVTVVYSRGTVELPWDSRERLLDRLAGFPKNARVVQAFRDGGAGGSVELDLDDMRILHAVVTVWVNEVPSGSLPAAIEDLWRALGDHLRDAEQPDD